MNRLHVLTIFLWSQFFSLNLLANQNYININLARDQFLVNVYLPQMPADRSKAARCITYHKGRILNQSLVYDSNYYHPLNISLLKEPVFVRCSHPDFEDTGGELGPAQFYQQLQRNLYLNFNRPKMLRGIETHYNQRQQIRALTFEVELAKPYLEELTLPGIGTFQRISFENLSVPYLEGEEYELMPEVPVLNPLIAVPWNSQLVHISMRYEDVYQFDNVKLLPVQPPIPESPELADPDAVKFNADIYYSTKIRVGQEVYKQRIDANSYQLQKILTHLVNYDAATGRLEIPKKIHVEIAFQPNSQCYSIFQTSHDQISAMLKQDFPLLLRQAINFPHVEQTKLCSGSAQDESPILYNSSSAKTAADIVIVTHAAFQSSAEILKKHKQELGWYTQLLVVEQMKVQELRQRLSALAPQWVILLGDAEFIETYYHNSSPYIINRFDRSFAAGDSYLGQGESDRLNPGNYSIGRLPVDSVEQAEAIVKKIINYEWSPPTKPTFFERPTWTANLEYARPLEEYYRSRAIHYGLNPKRLYLQLDEEIPAEWDYLINSDTNWMTAASHINNHLSQGLTSILLHRGHANWFGWQAPSYQLADVEQMLVSQNYYPFILSINCSSGFFDNETARQWAVPPSPPRRGQTPYSEAKAELVTLAEAMIRKYDGALGVIADTRASDFELNRTLSEGAFDYIYQSAVIEAGSWKQGRLGQILLAAKAAVVSQHSSQNEIATQILIYNLMGDPSIYLHREPPFQIADFQVEPRTLSGSFRLVNKNCQDCDLTLALQRPIMISLSDSSGIRQRVLGMVGSDAQGVKRVYFRLNASDSKENLSLTVSGPGLIPFKMQLGNPLANLKLGAITGPKFLKPGVNPGTKLSFEVLNESDTPAQGSMDRPNMRGYMIDLILSTDEKLPATWAVYQPSFREDVLLRGGRMSNTYEIAAWSRTQFVESDLEIPLDTPAGRYCLGINIDAGNDVKESNENDNNGCHWLEVGTVVID